MKTRCLCPPPEAYPDPDSPNFIPLWQRKLGTILHFKVATTECSRCGVPLCEDCGVEINNWILAGDYGVFKSIDPPKALCPTCAEEGR